MSRHGLWIGGLLAGCLLVGCSKSDDESSTGGVDTTADGVGGDVAGGDSDTVSTDTATDDTATDDTATDDTATDDTATDDTQVEGDAATDDTQVEGDTAPLLPSCEAYCDAVTAACTGENQQYADKASCVAYCDAVAALPPGTAADTSGNTVGCRMYHAGVAAEGATQAATHCPHAGPTGGNVCGTWCDNYCHLAESNCTGANAITFGTDCATDCAALNAAGEPGASTGDSVQCRIYHLGVAGSNGATSAATHCPHAGVDGGGVCVSVVEPTCASYCATVTAACKGEYAQYASEAACVEYCTVAGKLAPGTVDDTSGNTVGCRAYHAGVAGSNGDVSAATHCAHAGPSGGNVCGTWCDNYCHLALGNCSADDTLFTDDATCQTACGAYPNTATPGATSGDSVQCKIYHLGVAGSNGATSAATHCPHAGVDGGGVCAAPDPSCTAYCNTVMTNCTGEYAQYASVQACIDYCATAATLPLGTAADTSGNTVGCRSYHAGVAGTNGDVSAAAHCVHAGPTGGDVCGSWCDNYCHLSQTNCSGDNELFADTAKCLTACAAYPTSGDPGTASGDSVQCKLYHLGVAGSNGATSAATHCPHAGVDGGGVCAAPVVDPSCSEYCTEVMASCSGSYAQYPSMQACLDYCGTSGSLPLGTSDDTSGNTVGCRTYHAGVAGSNGDVSAAAHCEHAGPTGGDVCGTWCENYCHLESVNCSGANSHFVDDAACLAACAAYPTDGAAGDTTGDNVQCKIYHLGVAGTDGATSAATHCPHGGVDGGGVCVDPTPAPTFASVSPIYQAKCGGCHTGGGSGGHNIGSGNVATGYSESQKAAYSLAGTKGAATLLRIKNGSMPQGGGCSGDPATDAGKTNCLTAAEQAAIQAWLDGGQQPPAP